MGFRWKVTMADGSTYYPVSEWPVNGLPQIAFGGYVHKLEIQISHDPDVSPDSICQEIRQMIFQWGYLMWDISHGKRFNECVQDLQIPVIQTSEAVYEGQAGMFCVSSAVIEFYFEDGYGDDTNSWTLRNKLYGILHYIDDQLQNIWPFELTSVQLIGGID